MNQKRNKPLPSEARGPNAKTGSARPFSDEEITQPGIPPREFEHTVTPDHVMKTPDEDAERTVVERANPLKEAFDARTLVNPSQPKRFNPDETQTQAVPLMPAPAAPAPAKRAPAAPSVTSTASAAKSDARPAPVPPAPATVMTPTPLPLVQANRTATPPEPPIAFGEETKRDIQVPAEMRSNETPVTSQLHLHEDQFERPVSPVTRMIEGMKESPRRLFRTKNPRVRNAVVAGLIAVVATGFWMTREKQGGSDLETSAAPPVAANLPAAENVARTVAADPGPPHGVESPVVANRGAVTGVSQLMQQFDRSFTKTQDQR